MHTSVNLLTEPPNQPGPGFPTWRYWLFWALLIAALAYGIHRYFEYRNQELDRRLEQLI